MKKIFLLLSVLASSLCMNAQNIKYVEAVGEERFNHLVTKEDQAYHIEPKGFVIINNKL